MGVRMSYELPSMGDEVPVTVAGVYERAQNPWMRSGKRTMFLTLEDAYGLYECVCFESKLPKIAPVVARASYFLVRGRLQNKHKRGLAIVAEDVLDLEEVLASRRAKQAPSTSKAEGPTTGTRGDGRSRRGHPESRGAGQLMWGANSSGRESCCGVAGMGTPASARAASIWWLSDAIPAWAWKSANAPAWAHRRSVVPIRSTRAARTARVRTAEWVRRGDPPRSPRRNASAADEMPARGSDSINAIALSPQTHPRFTRPAASPRASSTSSR